MPTIKSIAEGPSFLEIQPASTVHIRRVTFENFGKAKTIAGIIQLLHAHERSFFAPKCGDRTQEDTLAKERWPRRAAWDLAKQVYMTRGPWIKTEPEAIICRGFWGLMLNRREFELS